VFQSGEHYTNIEKGIQLFFSGGGTPIRSPVIPLFFLFFRGVPSPLLKNGFTIIASQAVID
jgi:hypothetical protein